MPQTPKPAKPTVRSLTESGQPLTSMKATLTSTLSLLSMDQPYWSNIARALQGELEPVPDEEVEGVAPVCPGCGGYGWVTAPRSVRPGEPGYGRARPCPVCSSADMEQRSLDRKMKIAGVSPQWTSWTFDTYRSQPKADLKAADYVEAWAREGEGSLFLYGPVGRGKTGLAIPAFRQRIADGKAPTHLYLRSIDLFRRLWASNRRNSEESDSDITMAVCECALLLLDDLGVELEGEKVSDYVKRKLYEIIGDRHDRGRSTIFTTNLKLIDLEKGLGDRTYWRILEMCEPNLFLMSGTNLRDRRAHPGGRP